MSRVVDSLIAYRILRMFAQPIEKHPAYQMGIVDKDGNVFHKGKEQPKLKGTLPPTKVKPRKKKKKLTADQKLFKKAADWKKRLKAKRGK